MAFRIRPPFLQAVCLCWIEGLFLRSPTFAAAEIWGRKWYEDGKFLNKKNTFTDFIACAEYLIEPAVDHQRFSRDFGRVVRVAY